MYAELVEWADEWEEIKEEKKFLKNGMCLEYIDPVYVSSVAFNTEETKDKRDKKMEAYKTIMERCEEMNGGLILDNYDTVQDKYELWRDFEGDCISIQLSTAIRSNDFVLERYQRKVPEQIQDAVKTYFTS